MDFPGEEEKSQLYFFKYLTNIYETPQKESSVHILLGSFLSRFIQRNSDSKFGIIFFKYFLLFEYNACL